MASAACQRSLIRTLLACGALSSIVYVLTDIVGGLSYPGYNYAAQAISEMSAQGAPTTELLALYGAFAVLFFTFAIGVWLAGYGKSQLRWSAGLLFGVAVAGVGLSLFPMNVRGVERTSSDTMHLLFAGANVALLSGAIVAGGISFDRAFRRYSVSTVVVMPGFFVLTLLDAPNVAANRPTPYMGLNERICIAAWLLWIATFSVKLVRTKPHKARASE